MSYIGNQPTSVAFLTDTFSGDGSDTTFTLSQAPANTSSILVAVSGVVQDPSTYSVSGTTITFSGAPPSGSSNISVRFLGIPASGVATTAYRTVTTFTATSGQTTFSVPSYTVGYIDVYRNGVKLGTADFTATSGTSVVLASGATAGDLVETVSFYVSSVLNAIPAVANAVTDTYINTGAVTTAKIADAAVTPAKLSQPLTSGTSVTASTTTVSFTGIPSWAKRITFMLYGLSSSGGSNWLIQLGTSGGFVTSGYLGAGAYAGGTNVCGGNNFTAGFGIQNGGGAQVFHGQLVLNLFDASTNTWVGNGVYGDSSQAYIFTTGGSVPLSGVATQIRITHTNPADSFDAGKLNIFYE